MRLGIFLPNWIGDVVMATPAIRALCNLARHDGGQLVGIMRPYVADVLGGSDWFDDVIYYHKQARLFPFASRHVYEQLRAARLDRVVLLTNSLRTAWMARRSGARERIGYRGDMRAWLLTTRLRRQSAPLPTIDAYLHVASAAGASHEPPTLELQTTEADETAADAVWQTLGLSPSDNVVVLNSGGAYGGAKHWPADYFAELARRIVANNDRHVLVNCGPAERVIARSIVRLADDPRVVGLSESPDLPIGLTKACIRRSRLVVTTDSGPRFLAIAFGIPVVTLFGPTDPAATATHYERETCLSIRLECQPCMARTCPLGHHRCMRELTVDFVYDAVISAFESEPIHSAA